MYKVEYMDIPSTRKRRTIESLPHCKLVFSGIEKFISANPIYATDELHREGSKSFRFYEYKLHIKQQIPRIRMRIQCYEDEKLILIDQIAVYDHEMDELFLDDEF